MEETARILGISVNATKARVLMDERNCERIETLFRITLDCRKGHFTSDS
jgi:hypothetical protein